MPVAGEPRRLSVNQSDTALAEEKALPASLYLSHFCNYFFPLSLPHFFHPATSIRLKFLPPRGVSGLLTVADVRWRTGERTEEQRVGKATLRVLNPSAPRLHLKRQQCCFPLPASGLATTPLSADANLRGERLEVFQVKLGQAPSF